MGLSHDFSCEAGSLSCCRPNPRGIFNQRFEVLFPCAGALGYVVCFAPHSLSGLSVRECVAAGCYLPLCLPRSLPLSVWPCWFICTNVGPQDLPVVRLSAPFVPHSASLGPATANASPLRPGCPSPPFIPVWMNVYFLFPWCQTSLPFDFLSVLVVRGSAVCLPTPPSLFFTQVGTLNTIEYTSVVLNHFAFPLYMIIKKSRWEL